jgi:hypothetical protein
VHPVLGLVSLLVARQNHPGTEGQAGTPCHAPPETPPRCGRAATSKATAHTSCARYQPRKRKHTPPGTGHGACVGPDFDFDTQYQHPILHDGISGSVCYPNANMQTVQIRGSCCANSNWCYGKGRVLGLEPQATSHKPQATGLKTTHITRPPVRNACST